MSDALLARLNAVIDGWYDGNPPSEPIRPLLRDCRAALLESQAILAERIPREPTEAPQSFVDYVARNYSGEVVFSDPAWHAKRLWRAAMYDAVPGIPRERDAERDQNAKRYEWVRSMAGDREAWFAAHPVSLSQLDEVIDAAISGDSHG